MNKIHCTDYFTMNPAAKMLGILIKNGEMKTHSKGK